MMGVVTMPPMAPSDVMVMVEPVSSSRVAVPAFAASARRLSSAAEAPEIERFRVLDHRHHQPRRRLRRDADMHARMLVDDPRLVVEMRVEIGLLVDGANHGAHEEGQEREFRLILALARVERRAKILKRRDVDLLHVGDVRDAGTRQ